MMDNAERQAAVAPDALGELFARTVGASEALARALTRDSHLAEDIAQEAFIKAAARLPYLREPGAFDAYLRRTVVNLCRAWARRSASERDRNQRVRGEPVPSTQLSAHEDALWQAVRRLPYRQQAAIVLRYYEDLSESQTARVLRCSERAVNSLVSRAMVTLRQVVEEDA